MYRTAGLLVYAVGAIGRRAGRSLATGMALAVVTGALGSALFLTDALRAEALREVNAAPDLTVSRLHGGRPAGVSTHDAAVIQGILGVTAARARVWGALWLDGAAASLTVVGVEPGDTAGDLQTVVQRRGWVPDARGWVVPGEGVATLLGLQPGDGMELGAPGGTVVTLRVAALTRSASAVRTADVVLCAVPDARTALGLTDTEATDVAVTVATEEETPVVARKIREALPGVVVNTRAALARGYALTYGRRGGSMVIALLPALLALLVMAWDRASGLGSAERAEVAALRCAGWSPRDVVTARVMEAGVVALGATLAGALAAYGYVFCLDAPGMRQGLLGFSTLLPRLDLTPTVTLGQLLTLACLAAGPYVAAAVVPAWRAATLDPAEALRS